MARPMEWDTKLDAVGVERTPGRKEMRTKFWTGNLNRKHHLEDIRLYQMEVLEWLLKYHTR